MAPVAPLFASLLAIATIVEAGPLGGSHKPPELTRGGSHAARARRALNKIVERYYGDAMGMSKPAALPEKRAKNMPADWAALGCMNESYGQRLLADTAFSSDKMTPLMCMTQCQKLGFSLAGTEYTDECYCGNSFTGSGGQSQPAAACNMPCKGDASEQCGAPWFLNVYQHNATSSCVTPGSPSAGPSASATVSATASPSSTASQRPTYNNTLDHSEWYSLGCAVDTNTRILTGYSELYVKDLTVDSCLSSCEDKGFAYAGVEYGSQCYCGASIPQTLTWDAGLCMLPCAGDNKDTCGGFWAMEVYELISSGDCPATTSASASATVIGNEHIVVPSTTASPSQNNVPSPQGSAVSPQPSTQPPSSSGNQVWAHHMVGNAYPYTQNDWLIDIRAASAQGIDGFALNLGHESWQIDRAADAFAAAQSSGTGFKLFLSLDLTSLGCWSGGDAANLVSIVQRFAHHPNAAQHNGKVLVSTFAGSDCNFGTGSGSAAWQWMFVDALKNQGTNIFFVPSIFSDVSTFSGNTWMDGELNWNSAWPMGNNQISTDTDNRYMNALGGKEYMGAVSPFFYTHFGADLWNKNWLYRSDDWMYCTRWEQLIASRDRIRQVEILTWNDYGESSYIGPIHGALPGYSSKWVDGFDHQGLAPLTQYYATAYKTGSYPQITKDTLVLWSRPHGNGDNAPDYIGKPTGWDWTTDNVWAVALTTSDAVVTLTSGSNTQTFNVKAGLTKLKIANSPGGISGKISRNGGDVASVNINGQFTHSPSTYNYNYYVGSS